LLEDAWGRPLFAGLYVVGGMVAALANMALDWTSLTPMLGASGAIATLMGAFTVRFPQERIRVGYFIWFLAWVWRGTFLLPAWLGGMVWAGSELYAFLHGTHPGVAIIAHLAGFGFGVVVALLIRMTRVEEKVLQPALEEKSGWTQHPGVEQGRAALRNQDLVGARNYFQEALTAQPDSLDAELGLARTELLGHEARGLQRCERLLTRFISHGDRPHLYEVVQELADLVDPAQLRPVVALRTASALEEGPEGLRLYAERYYAAAGSQGGAAAPRALLRAAELRLESTVEPEGAQAYLEQLERMKDVPPELAPRIEGLRLKVTAQRAANPKTAPSRLLRRIPSFLEMPAVGRTPGTPNIVRGRLLELGPAALRVRTEEGKEHELALRNVLAVGVGMTPRPTPQAPRRNVVVTDLVVDWGQEGRGPGVLRLESTDLRLSTHYPELPPPKAYREFLQHVLKQSGANPLSALEGPLEGRFQLFESESALTASLYGGATTQLERTPSPPS
jgi:hypothetical protein